MRWASWRWPEQHKPYFRRTVDTVTRAEVEALVKDRRLGLVFTRAEALAAGLTLGQLRGSAVRRVYRGVFTTADDPASLAIRARAAVKLAGPDALVCHTTGLALLGVELPDPRATGIVHLHVPGPRPRLPGITVHRDRLVYPAKRTPAGVGTVSPAECWLQCARSLPVRDLVVLADGLMRRQDPILFRGDLEGALVLADGRRGVRRARQAFALAREGTDSPMETLVRLALVGAGLPCPLVNHPLVRPGRAEPYFLDMAYPDALVAIEHDGAYHGTPEQMRRDQTRRRWIEDRGWRLITATAADLPDFTGVVASVRLALHR